MMIAKDSRGGWPGLRQAASAGWALTLLAGATGVLARTDAGVPIEVRAGDSFSRIAARHVDKGLSWRSMYRAGASRLPNPDHLAVGMRLEVVTDDKGRYLRVVTAGSGDAAASRPAVAAAAPAPPVPGSRLPGGRASVPSPAPAAASAPAIVAAPAPTGAAAPAAGSTAAAMPPAGGASGARDSTLVVGVVPNIPATLLTSQYAYLKSYLERVGHQPVRIVVPASFKAFFDGTMQGAYDVAVAAPHFARVAQLDRGMVPLVTYEPRINALLVAPLDSPLAGPRELRERSVAFANPTSLVALYGQQWLRQQGLEANQDYAVKGVRTDLGVGRMMLTGEAAAAIMSNGEFRALPADESTRLKVVETFARMPNFIVLGHPRIGSERLARLKAELKDFLADKSDGAAFRQATGFNAIVDVDDSTLRELDPFTAATRRAMGPAQ